MSLPRLTLLAEILRERELARLSAASLRAGALRNQLEALQASVRSRALSLARMAESSPGSSGSDAGGHGARNTADDAGRDSDGTVAGGPRAVADGPSEMDPALAGGVEGRWLLWLSRERQALERRYLLQLAEIEDLRAQSSRAFGRADVLAKLTVAQRRQMRQTREKRAGTGPAAHP